MFKSICIFLLCTFSLSSCFEIKEKIYVKKDGSGTYSFTVDLSPYQNSEEAFKNYIANTPQQSNIPIEKLNPSQKVLLHFAKMEFYLETVKGISDYQVINDSIHHTIGASCKFSNMEALNHFIHVLKTGKNEGKPETVYTLDEKSFTRTSANIFNEQVVFNASVQDSLTSFYLVNAEYNIEYSFEKKYLDYSNEQYFTDKNREKLFFNAELKELTEKKISPAGKVIFSK